MSESKACPECGVSVPSDAPHGLCPRCLMGAAVMPTGLHRPAGAKGGRPGPAPIVDRAEFLGALCELDLGTADDLARVASAATDDLIELSRGLVREGVLTAYQAAALLQGKSRGLVIGQYLVLDKLGVGGMGVVFRGKHRPSGRVVALKILPPSFGRDAEAVRRFRREFQIASRLSHPNLVAALEASEDRGVHYLTMEFIPGVDLDRLVANGGPMALKLALHCAIQVARGLEAAHAQGVIHRDIKPGNVMIDPAGAVRVLDLGLARVIAATSGFAKSSAGTLTQTGSYMGTVDFLAPEQANDAKAADGRADIYSLACTLYFLLAGRPPFPGDSVLKRLMAHQAHPAPMLRAARPEVPEALEAVYQRMMAKDPADRPQAISEVVLALEGCRTSAREAGDASADLKTFARTAMKRAPARPEPGPNDSVFARPKPRPDLLTFDSDLDLEDLVAGYRDEVKPAPIPELDLPPIASRPLSPRPRRRRPSPPYALLALVCLGCILVGYALLSSPAPVLSPPKPVGAPAPILPTPTVLPKADVPIAVTPGFRPLFNGRDLSGWLTHHAQPGRWRVEDGVLIGSGPDPSHLYTERDDFADVHLRIEARINEGGNSGLYARSSFGPAWPADRPRFPMGVEAQIYGRLGEPIRTGSLYIEPGRIVGNTPATVTPPGRWFVLEMILDGGHVVVKVDGQVTADYQDPAPAARRGRVALQQHDSGAFVEFRKVEAREIPAEVAATPAAPPVARPRVLLSEDFKVPHVGWYTSTPEELALEENGAHGFGDGLWYLTSRGYAEFSWNTPGGPFPDMEAEVKVKVVAEGNTDPRGGALIVFFEDVPGAEGDRARRGFMVRINAAGQLMLEPNFHTARAYPNGPWRGPLTHPALRPAGQPNLLKFRVKGRTLEIFADGQRVADPIVFDWDLTPATISLGADSWSGIVRAEFDKIEILAIDP